MGKDDAQGESRVVIRAGNRAKIEDLQLGVVIQDFEVGVIDECDAIESVGNMLKSRALPGAACFILDDDVFVTGRRDAQIERGSQRVVHAQVGACDVFAAGIDRGEILVVVEQISPTDLQLRAAGGLGGRE